MKKSIRRTLTTIVVMIGLAFLVLWFYDNLLKRTEPLFGGSEEQLTKAEKLIQKDLELYYPETPREVVRLFGNMLKTLYGELSDEETEALALKIRELYDEEFLANNPKEEYIKNLYSELAEWKDKDRRITNYLFSSEKEPEQSVIDGRKYNIEYVYFTIQENMKYKEQWRILLRLDEAGKWKILGWETISVEEE